MVTHPRLLVGLLLALAANLPPARARAEDLGESGKRAPSVASPSSSSRIDLRGALASHDDRVISGGQHNQAQGSAVTHLGVAGLWLERESPFGVAADLALERFALTRQGGGGADAVATGLEISSGVVARLARGRWALDGQLGYAFMRVPFAAADPATADAAGDATALQAHGPELAARVALALAPFADIEARGRVIPRTFGARHGADSASLQRYAIGAGARLGSFDLATWRLSLLVDYDLVVSNGLARDFTLDQSQHRVGLGLRAAWPAPVVIAPPPPIPAVLPPSGRVRGRVRAARAGRGFAEGAPLAGVTVTPADGAAVTTDGDGRFVLAGREPALTRIAVTRDGFTAAEEVVAVPRQGDVEIEIRLQPDGPAPVGVLFGFVRGEDGIPVGATITVRELKLSTRADRKGHFRLEVPPGRYELTIVAPNFERQTKVVVVGPGEQNIFNLDLQRHR